MMKRQIKRRKDMLTRKNNNINNKTKGRIISLIFPPDTNVRCSIFLFCIQMYDVLRYN